MKPLKLKRPHFSEEEAGVVVLDLWGIRAAVRELPSERDQNTSTSCPTRDRNMS
jgi:hypothetical protein